MQIEQQYHALLYGGNDFARAFNSHLPNPVNPLVIPQPDPDLPQGPFQPRVPWNPFQSTVPRLHPLMPSPVIFDPFRTSEVTSIRPRRPHSQPWQSDFI